MTPYVKQEKSDLSKFKAVFFVKPTQLPKQKSPSKLKEKTPKPKIPLKLTSLLKILHESGQTEQYAIDCLKTAFPEIKKGVIDTAIKETYQKEQEAS